MTDRYLTTIFAAFAALSVATAVLVASFGLYAAAFQQLANAAAFTLYWYCIRPPDVRWPRTPVAAVMVALLLSTLLPETRGFAAAAVFVVVADCGWSAYKRKREIMNRPTEQEGG